MAKMKKLEDLFHDTLKDVYFAEKKILREPTENGEGRAACRTRKLLFEKHLGETEVRSIN